MTNAQGFVQRAERARDLKDQMEAALGAEEDQEFQFYEWSPGRTYVSLWDLQTGERIELPRYQAVAALGTKDDGGNYRFTADETQAPTRILNTTKCMFHTESPQRPFLEDSGVVGRNEIVCRSEHLAGDSAMLLHAENRHQNRYKRAKEAMEKAERDEERRSTLAMQEAMLEVARNSQERRGPGRPRKEDES